MNYKRSRILSIFLLVAVIVLSVLTFTACTKYKANKVSGIDSNAKVEGNGTQVVIQVCGVKLLKVDYIGQK